MPGKTPSQAVKAFLHPLQAAVSCVTPELLMASADGYNAGAGHSVTFNKGIPCELRRKDLNGEAQPSLFLSVVLSYEVVEVDDRDRGPWKVRTSGYWYHVLDGEDQEVILFHWHPDPPNRVTTPHVKIGGPELGTHLHGKMHIPTGRVALEQVLLFLVQEMGVNTLREDAEATLEKHLAAFREWSTWTY